MKISKAVLLSSALAACLQANADNPYGKCSAPDKGLTDEAILKTATQNSMKSRLYKNGIVIRSTGRWMPDNTYHSEGVIIRDGRSFEYTEIGTWSLKNGVVTYKAISVNDQPPPFPEPFSTIVQSIIDDTVTSCDPKTGDQFTAKLIPLK